MLVLLGANALVWLAIIWPVHVSTAQEATALWIGGASALLGLSLANLFEGIVNDTIRSIFFVLIQAPFDIGDRVVIDGLTLRVLKINTFMTSFVRQDTGTLHYKKNLMLCDKIVCNQSNSYWSREAENRMGKSVRTLVFSEPCTGAKMGDLRRALIEILGRREPDFTGTVTMMPAHGGVSHGHLGDAPSSDTAHFCLKIEVFYRGDLHTSAKGHRFDRVLEESTKQTGIVCEQVF